MLPSIAFKEHYQVLRFWQLSVRVAFKRTVKYNNYWIFQIFFSELETKEG